MAELPVSPQQGNDPDDGGWKGRRAEQEAASATAPLASGPLGGVAGAAAQPQGPVGSDAASGAAATAAGGPPWGGPVHNPVGQGVAGYGTDTGPDQPGPDVALGAVYGPGSDTPAGVAATPIDPSAPVGFAAPTDQGHTSLADAGRDTGEAVPAGPGWPASSTRKARADPPARGPQNAVRETT